MGTLRSVTGAHLSRLVIDGADPESALSLLPLPCPDPSDELSPAALRAHAHRCASCGERYRCAGAGETGFCTPVCPPCHWVELGGQLAAHRAIVSALERKRRQIEKSSGRAACLQALENKRRSTALGTAGGGRRNRAEDAGAVRD